MCNEVIVLVQQLQSILRTECSFRVDNNPNVRVNFLIPFTMDSVCLVTGVIALFTLPKVYETNKAQIDQNLALVHGKINELTAK